MGKRKHDVWTPDNWNDGYFDNRGRFRVYRPDYPRAYALGYALRAHVVWWLAHGEPHPANTQLHHKNENRADDWLENLEPLTSSEHLRRHRPKSIVRLECQGCGREIRRAKDRVRYTRAFCSLRCYNSVPRLPEHVAAFAGSRWRAA